LTIERGLVRPGRRNSSPTQEIATPRPSTSTYTHIGPGRGGTTETEAHAPAKASTEASSSSKSVRHIFTSFGYYLTMVSF
jgi:hypothetical protein